MYHVDWKRRICKIFEKLGLTYEQAKDKAILYDNVLVPKIVEGKKSLPFWTRIWLPRGRQNYWYFWS